MGTVRLKLWEEFVGPEDRKLSYAGADYDLDSGLPTWKEIASGRVKAVRQFLKLADQGRILIHGKYRLGPIRDSQVAFVEFVGLCRKDTHILAAFKRADVLTKGGQPKQFRRPAAALLDRETINLRLSACAMELARHTVDSRADSRTAKAVIRKNRGLLLKAAKAFERRSHQKKPPLLQNANEAFPRRCKSKNKVSSEAERRAAL